MRRICILSVLLLMVTTLCAQYREVKIPEKGNVPEYKDYETKNEGFWIAAEVEGGSSIMESKSNKQYVALTAIAGYRRNEFLRFGLGFGGRVYVNNAFVERESSSRYTFPVFANIRGNFISAYDRDGVPFWSLNIGSMINEGFFFSPTIGYSFGGIRNNFMIGLAYTMGTFKKDDEKKSTAVYSYLGLKIGYEF